MRSSPSCRRTFGRISCPGCCQLHAFCQSCSGCTCLSPCETAQERQSVRELFLQMQGNFGGRVLQACSACHHLVQVNLGQRASMIQPGWPQGLNLTGSLRDHLSAAEGMQVSASSAETLQSYACKRWRFPEEVSQKVKAPKHSPGAPAEQSLFPGRAASLQDSET